MAINVPGNDGSFGGVFKPDPNPNPDAFLVLAGSRKGIVSLWAKGLGEDEDDFDMDKYEEFRWKDHPIQSVHFAQVAGGFVVAFSGQSVRVWQVGEKRWRIGKGPKGCLFTGSPLGIPNSIPENVKLFAMSSKYVVGFDKSSEHGVCIIQRRNFNKKIWEELENVPGELGIESVQKNVAEWPTAPRLEDQANEYSYTEIVRIHPKDRCVITASNHPVNPGRILLHRPKEEEARALNGHEIGIASLAFSHDGRQVVSGSWDTTLRTWKVVSGQEIFTMKGSDGGVTVVAFSPDAALPAPRGPCASARPAMQVDLPWVFYVF